MDDWTLLRTYAREGSEEAFAELVSRHVTMVYSAAARQTWKQTDLAQEITQKTFCLLAQKAHSLPERGPLAGWLYQTACNLSRETIRAETRRRAHEETVAHMQSLDSDTNGDSLWEEAGPVLDELIQALPEPDRLALVLRFLQSKPMREVGLAFGTTEVAARMRVSRALEKLRALFAKRGLKIATLTLAAWLEERSNASLPANLVPALNKIPSQSLPLVTPVSVLTKALLFMAKINLPKAVTLALLGMLGLTVGVKTLQNQEPSPPPAAQRPSLVRLMPSKVPVRLSSANPNIEIPLTNAIENLKSVLTSSWSRKPPFERVAEALKLFGANRTAALPVLMAEFNKPKGTRSTTVMILSIHGLTMLGVDAASALPDLTKLALSGDIAFTNDMIPKLFLAVDPTGSSVPDLIKGLSDPNTYYFHQIQATISQLIDANPGSENIYRPLLSDLLADPNIDFRRRAAFLLARLPGELDSDTINTLVGSFALESLRDPKAYDPIITDGSYLSRDGDRMRDENLRNEAVNSLRAAGPKAQAALPELLEVAQLLPVTNMFRPNVIEAIGLIDPTYRAQSPEVGDRLNLVERGRELTDLAKQRSASFDQLLEGLQNPISVYSAAEALADLGEDARPALPQLLKALDQFDDYQVAQRIKDLDPNLLVEELSQKHLGGLYEIAETLGELGPTMTSALPTLNAVLSDMKTGDPNLLAVAGAIQKIDPNHPKMVFDFPDLHEAANALMNSIYENDKTKSPVYTSYINDFQDLNSMGRPQLLKFVEATKADPDLHRIFVTKLLEKNPMLASQIELPTP